MTTELSKPQLRVPAEWEHFDTVMLAWPHKNTDWEYMLAEVSACYVDIAAALIKAGMRLLIVTPEPEEPKRMLNSLPQEKIAIVQLPTNDTWTRDYGPITLEKVDGTTALADFCFNGWGLKFAADKDNMVNLRLLDKGIFTKRFHSQLGFVFEGGAMEVDGKGTMLSTKYCLMSLNRNGYIPEDKLAAFFRQSLGVERLLLLSHGALAGDDTDSHIDTLARFATEDTILYVKCYNPADPHFEELQQMEDELKQLRTADGMPYNLIALPLPDPIYDENGERLPATYANFLITPHAVLLPVYGQPDNDRMAKMTLEIAFHNREIICVDCRALIKQHGSLHCATMQLKKETLN